MDKLRYAARRRDTIDPPMKRLLFRWTCRVLLVVLVPVYVVAVVVAAAGIAGVYCCAWLEDVLRPDEVQA